MSSLQYWSTHIERLQLLNPFFQTSLPPLPDYFTRVPSDIFLQIARCLPLRELIVLRLTCCRFYILTHEAAIWKTRYKNAEILLPRLPPTACNTLENVSSAVCEQALRRAYAIESEWQRKECRPAHNFFNALGFIHCMSIVPGGRYLAVCTTVNSEPTLSIWDLEVPGNNPFAPKQRRAALVNTILPGRVAEMTTKYLRHRSTPGIAIAVSGSTGNNGTRFWAVFWARLDNLEEYTETQARNDTTTHQLQAIVRDWDPPFKTLAKKYTRSAVYSLCLDTVEGRPLVALVRDGKDIVLQFLESNKRSFVIPVDPWADDNDANPPWAEPGVVVIRAIKVLPAQNKLLVIREVRHASPVWPVFWYATYPIPSEGACVKAALYEVQFQEADIKSIDFFSFSDESYGRNSIPDAISPTNRESLARDISIWAVNSGTTAGDDLPSVILRRLKPVTQTNQEATGQHQEMINPGYSLDSLRLRFPGDRPVAISGGARRGIWFLPPRDSKHPPESLRVGEIVRYMATDMDPSQNSEEDLQKELVTIKLPEPLLKGLNSGMAAHAFDESIGRLVVATRDDELVHILDFGDHIGIAWPPDICKTH